MSTKTHLKQKFDVWTDGSYRHKGNLAGIGYVIRHDGETHKGSRHLPSLSPGTIPFASDFVEIFAITAALRKIPEGSVVCLRSDCQNVIDWLQKREMRGKPQTRHALKSPFDQALQAIDRMESVTFIKAGDRTNEGMRVAHILAQTAAAPVRT
ncbi:MAG: hypothetical protein DI586_03845 [Micavibrio aeruginosavorus]|uniref:RNase H type-1 domain-containing protein n=1 Tax=Micavibrio aeruginosavorus TaxID=349221 RepID=A0A2W5FK07_9BACT|nr:MAG: hypothetical protein DI586_03845 [Micavibrio aeruginosavorus]